MIQIIFLEKNQGATDRLLGDGLLVYFGIPIGEENYDEARRAIQTAQYIQQNYEFVAKRHLPPEVAADFGIIQVIHSGDVVVGEMENKFGDKEPTIIGILLEQTRMLAHYVASKGSVNQIWLSESAIETVQESLHLKVEWKEELSVESENAFLGIERLFLLNGLKKLK